MTGTAWVVDRTLVTMSPQLPEGVLGAVPCGLPPDLRKGFERLKKPAGCSSGCQTAILTDSASKASRRNSL